MRMADLPERWRHRAADIEQFAPPAAVAFRECAEEFERELAGVSGELLTLEQGASVSGYTADHLGALIRAGKLANYGRKHAPRVRHRDLPVKPNALTPAPHVGIVVATDRRSIARSVLSQPKGGPSAA